MNLFTRRSRSGLPNTPNKSSDWRAGCHFIRDDRRHRAGWLGFGHAVLEGIEFWDAVIDLLTVLQIVDALDHLLALIGEGGDGLGARVELAGDLCGDEPHNQTTEYGVQLRYHF